MSTLKITNEFVENKKWPQYAATTSCVLSMIVVGITTSWTSPSLPKLLSKTHPLHLTENEVSNVTIIPLFGNIIGVILFTVLADIIGRKRVLLLAACPQICSFVLLNFHSYSVIILYIARIVGGVSEGGFACIVPVYIGEISEPKIRGSLLFSYSFAWLFGSLFIDIVGTYTSIEVAASISLLFPILFLITFTFVPESPYFYLMRNKSNEAKEALKRLRQNHNVEEEFSNISKDVKRQMSETGRYKDIFLIKSNRNSFFIIVVLSLVDAFTGVSVLEYYAQVFFQKNTTFIPKNWASSLMILIALICTGVSSSFVDRIGRKRLLLYSIGTLGLFLAVLSGYFFIVEGLHLDPTEFSWIPFVLVLFLDLNYNVGISNITSCLSGEIFSVTVKNKCMCVVAIIFSLNLALSTKIYQTITDHYGTGYVMAIFSICQFLGFWYTWKFVPETSGKTLEEIQQDIKNYDTATQIKNDHELEPL